MSIYTFRYKSFFFPLFLFFFLYNTQVYYGGIWLVVFFFISGCPFYVINLHIKSGDSPIREVKHSIPIQGGLRPVENYDNFYYRVLRMRYSPYIIYFSTKYSNFQKNVLWLISLSLDACFEAYINFITIFSHKIHSVHSMLSSVRG